MDWYLMGWRRYAEFDGRSRRSEYWMFTLFNILAYLALMLLGFAGAGMVNTPALRIVPFVLYALATVIPCLALTVRRFHDIGKSGWLVLLFAVLGMIPIVNIVTSIIQIVFLCTDGNPGMNQYGPSPKMV